MINNWTGDGTVVDSTASVDATCVDEYILLGCPPEYMESEPWYLGSGSAIINVNKYVKCEGTPYIEYKTGATKVDCSAATYVPYVSGFNSLGWVQIKVTNNI